MNSKKPHPLLLQLLQGPKVPSDFICDGCSMSPDAWFYWACRIHDYEYHKLRLNWVHIKVHKATILDNKFANPKLVKLLKEESEQWWVNRIKADQNLKTNIKILSRYKIKYGILKKRFIPHLAGYFISELYYKAVRIFGNKPAKG